MQTQTTQPLPRYSQYPVRLMAPGVWRTLASATQALWPTFGNHRIYQLQPAETESAPNVIRLLSAETECLPKVPIYPHSAPKPKPKPKFGRPLTMDNWLENTHAPVTFLLSFECNLKTLVNILIWLFLLLCMSAVVICQCYLSGTIYKVYVYWSSSCVCPWCVA